MDLGKKIRVVTVAAPIPATIFTVPKTVEVPATPELVPLKRESNG